MQEKERFVVDVASKIRCDWMKWRESVTAVLCDEMVALKVKEKFY